MNISQYYRLKAQGLGNGTTTRPTTDNGKDYDYHRGNIEQRVGSFERTQKDLKRLDLAVTLADMFYRSKGRVQEYFAQLIKQASLDLKFQ